MTILRSFNISGIGQSYDKEGAFIPKCVNQIIEGKNPVIFGGGEQTRDYTWVGDVAEAYYLLAMGNYSGTFHVGTGREVPIEYIAKTLIEISGKDLKIDYVGPRPKEIRRLKCDASKIKALGWQVTKQIEDVLKEMYEFAYMKHVGIDDLSEVVKKKMETCPWTKIYRCEEKQ